MKSSDFMDLAQAKLGIDSDNKLSAAMDLNRGHISQWRTGKREFSDRISVQFAEVLGLPPEYVIAEIHAHRAKDSNIKIVWQNLAAQAKKLHVVAIVAIALVSFAPAPAEAAVSATQQNAPVIYIMRICRRVREWLLALWKLPDDAIPNGPYSLVVLTIVAVAMLSFTGCAASPSEIDPEIHLNSDNRCQWRQ